MTGKATVYINGEVVFEKKGSVTKDVAIPLKKGLGTVEMNIFMQPDSKSRVLLADLVYVSPEKIKVKSDDK